MPWVSSHQKTKATMSALQTLPRFLLPRLSWQAPAAAAAAGSGAAMCRRSFGMPLPGGRVPEKQQQRPWAGPGRPFYSTASGGPSPSRARPRSTRTGATLRQQQQSTALGRRRFHASAPVRRDHHFDTLKFVQRLQSEGFTEEQSVAMMKVLNDVIEESIQNLTRTMVPREDAAKATYTQKVDFAKLRSELLAADSTESNTTRAAHERLTNDIAKLNSRLRDEIGRTQASVRLDLNLEKGRIREEAVSQELRIKETETKIEQEAAALRQQLEQVKFQTLQWLMGLCTGFAALMLGLWRLLM
ncbi:hypothetical protein RB597_007892 [Gaeumannomyces tritici]